jgi:hypothetical protein
MKEQGDAIIELRTNLEKEKENNQKMLETLGQLRVQCFSVASLCCNSMKKIFSFIGAASMANSYASKDTVGARLG